MSDHANPGGVSAGPPLTADPQDPLPESNWLWRRLLIFAGTALCAVGLGIILAILLMIAKAGVAMADSGNGAQIALHSIEALYNLGFWLVVIVLVNLTLYLIAPSAEQATKMIATVSALKGGVAFASRTALATPAGRAETASAAGPAAAPVVLPSVAAVQEAKAAATASPAAASPTPPAAAAAPAAAPATATPATGNRSSVTVVQEALAAASASPAVVAPVPPAPLPSPVPAPIGMISVGLLKVACPQTPAGGLEPWVEPIQRACARFEINTIRRVAAFIAQMAHESAGFTATGENLNYTAKRLTQVWPGRFPTIGHATPYARNPEKLANKVYASRMGNGDEASGDGWRFRGGGPLQVTGRSNWTRFAKAMGMKLDEALAFGRTVDGGVMAAAWFWEANDINRLADTPGVADETKLINGGTNGLADREKKFNALVAKMLKLERAAA